MRTSCCQCHISAQTSDGGLLPPLGKERPTLHSFRPAVLDLVVAVDT